MQSADYYLLKVGECAIAAESETDELEAALCRAFQREFLKRALED
jgi:hypothetical protein